MGLAIIGLVALLFLAFRSSNLVSAQYDPTPTFPPPSSCTVGGGASQCEGSVNTCDPSCQGSTPWCASGGYCVWTCYGGCDNSCTLWNDWTSCYWDGIRYVETRECIDGVHTDSQIQPCGPEVTPTPTGPGGTTPTPTGGGGATPTPTNTPPPQFFNGGVYDDADAVPGGLGGSDNLCTGETSTLANIGSASVNVQRAGENLTQNITSPVYTIQTGTNNDDYTVSLHLPFPPPDPENAWICACNAVMGDQYTCRYTNQQPNQGLTNFFVKRANEADSAWFQVLGGNSWASGNISSTIPAATCTPPICHPALVLTDPAGNVDSPGFPLSDSGSISTSLTGEVYIHETGSRNNAEQAEGLGVEVPVEGYDYFFAKFGDQAVALANANKPTPGSNPGVYLYTGNLTINETHGWAVPNTEQIIVFVDGNLTINDTTVDDLPRIITVTTGGTGFLMFIVSGDITIGSNLGYVDIYTDSSQANIAQVEGVYVADGIFTVARNPGNVDRKFIGAGTFVGWEGVDLQRTFDSGSTPEYNAEAATESFIFRPDFIVNAPQEIKAAQMTWREVAPRFE